LAPLLEECVEACRSQAAERGVTLQLRSAVSTELMLDKLKMKQAFINVLRNAIDASPIGATVAIEAAASDGGTAITIDDAGPGVADKDRESVFAPFFTTKDGGTGLGLAIAREFTEAHGGRLWVEPQPRGTGARFVTWLPAHAGGR
jgi:signal transduction histidine kinase